MDPKFVQKAVSSAATCIPMALPRESQTARAFYNPDVVGLLTTLNARGIWRWLISHNVDSD